jgi:hypothetical protein
MSRRMVVIGVCGVNAMCRGNVAASTVDADNGNIVVKSSLSLTEIDLQYKDV